MPYASYQLHTLAPLKPTKYLSEYNGAVIIGLKREKS